ncbi:uncharacterized protein LOC131041204 [Cryptomeria japonica]|uniref:uncharacterized protein LOC131041204 n=1 Tax=Cryptomeria japonica TaxID=3369 RepID=UPI0027DA0AC3|nr:uncharacterized protein LOC131041204 [Cryptomeria japonica]
MGPTGVGQKWSNKKSLQGHKEEQALRNMGHPKGVNEKDRERHSSGGLVVARWQGGASLGAGRSGARWPSSEVGRVAEEVGSGGGSRQQGGRAGWWPGSWGPQGTEAGGCRQRRASRAVAGELGATGSEGRRVSGRRERKPGLEEQLRAPGKNCWRGPGEVQGPSLQGESVLTAIGAGAPCGWRLGGAPMVGQSGPSGWMEWAGGGAKWLGGEVGRAAEEAESGAAGGGQG